MNGVEIPTLSVRVIDGVESVDKARDVSEVRRSRKEG
jgi:hypothetical protein